MFYTIFFLPAVVYSCNYGASDGLNPPQTIITALTLLSLAGCILLLLTCSLAPASPLFSKCFTSHSSLDIIPSLPLQMLPCRTLCPPCPLAVLYMALFLPSHGEQSPSLLLVPGPSRHCNHTPGISSVPTIAGRHDAETTL